jgi:NADPH-dependent 2,4-dienoyl-CoA reductase/sulfur reductase-like enzyme
VLGTGASAFVPKIPGAELEGVFTLKNLNDAIQMKTFIRDRGCRKAIIVGAGFIGMEMSEALRTLGIDTQVIDLLPRPAARWDPEYSKVILEELSRQNISFSGNTRMESIERGIDYRLRLNDDKGGMEADMILIAVGIRPNVKLANDLGLQIGKSGAIKVDFSQRTSKEGIYAVGDCCEVYHHVSKSWVYIPLGDVANKQGRVAGHNIGGGSMILPGVVGAQSFKLFTLEVAATGLDESEASDCGYHPVSTIIRGNAIARSMPGEKMLGIKLVADRATRKLLGAQAVGAMGVVSRINTLSCALWAGMCLDEIAYLDFAYAPPVGPAWDPIHIAAQELIRKL